MTQYTSKEISLADFPNNHYFTAPSLSTKRGQEYVLYEKTCFHEQPNYLNNPALAGIFSLQLGFEPSLFILGASLYLPYWNKKVFRDLITMHPLKSLSLLHTEGEVAHVAAWLFQYYSSLTPVDFGTETDRLTSRKSDLDRTLEVELESMKLRYEKAAAEEVRERALETSRLRARMWRKKNTERNLERQTCSNLRKKYRRRSVRLRDGCLWDLDSPEGQRWLDEQVRNHIHCRADLARRHQMVDSSHSRIVKNRSRQTTIRVPSAASDNKASPRALSQLYKSMVCQTESTLNNDPTIAMDIDHDYSEPVELALSSDGEDENEFDHQEEQDIDQWLSERLGEQSVDEWFAAINEVCNREAEIEKLAGDIQKMELGRLAEVNLDEIIEVTNTNHPSGDINSFEPDLYGMYSTNYQSQLQARETVEREAVEQEANEQETSDSTHQQAASEPQMQSAQQPAKKTTKPKAAKTQEKVKKGTVVEETVTLSPQEIEKFRLTIQREREQRVQNAREKSLAKKQYFRKVWKCPETEQMEHELQSDLFKQSVSKSSD